MGHPVKKSFHLLCLCLAMFATPVMSLAQSFTTLAAPVCPPGVSPHCATMARVAASCGVAKSPDEYAACANRIFSSVGAAEIDKVKNAAKQARDAAKAAAADAAPVFSVPPTPVCPKTGESGLLECELGKRAFAACGESKSNADFSECVRTFVSTKSFNCALAANAAEQGNCKKANSARAQ